MKNLMNKIAAAASGAVVFVAGLAIAGMGLALVGTMALFALCAVGVALLAAPFVSIAAAQQNAPTEATA